MNPTSSTRTVIVAAIEPSSSNDPVIENALSLARAMPGVEIHFIHAVDPGPGAHVLAVPLVDVLREGRTFLDKVVHAAAERHSSRIAGHLAVGEPSARILQLASDLAADLVIVGTRGGNALERLILGSVSRAVTQKARCPVLVARSKDYEAVPEIEPPCSACLEVQRASGGDTLWCERHSSRHAHARLHHMLPQTFGVGAMLIRPEH
ncbi:MAG TPA: universal stress protein [Labilithrix sp.]|nr:universal stress protein [Labilithrix sp.]